jgi:hypothetical protein
MVSIFMLDYAHRSPRARAAKMHFDKLSANGKKTFVLSLPRRPRRRMNALRERVHLH